MSRPLEKNLSGEEKYQLYSVGFTIINQLIEDGDYISSYVMIFSILEDRIYSMWYRRKNYQTGWTYDDTELAETYGGLSSCIQYLRMVGDLNEDQVYVLKRIVRERNGMVHKTFRNLQNFTEGNVKNLLVILRDIDKESKEQRKVIESSELLTLNSHYKSRLNDMNHQYKFYKRQVEYYEGEVKKLGDFVYTRPQGRYTNDPDKLNDGIDFSEFDADSPTGRKM